MDLANVENNQRKSKKRKWNEFSKVTILVKKYKETNSEEDLLNILKALEGIINSFTIILAPGNKFQQIHINPFMAKFLSCFLTPEEKKGLVSFETYYKAIARVRWITRKYEYSDIYSHIIMVLIGIINSMKVIGTCDCIFYIQLIARYKMHDFIIKSSEDAGISLAEIPINNDYSDNNIEDIIDRANSEAIINEEEENLILENITGNFDISVLFENKFVFKYLSFYEKYILYLKLFLQLTDKQICSILYKETTESLQEWIGDITYKCERLNEE